MMTRLTSTIRLRLKLFELEMECVVEQELGCCIR